MSNHTRLTEGQVMRNFYHGVVSLWNRSQNMSGLVWYPVAFKVRDASVRRFMGPIFSNAQQNLPSF